MPPECLGLLTRIWNPAVAYELPLHGLSLITHILMALPRTGAHNTMPFPCCSPVGWCNILVTHLMSCFSLWVKVGHSCRSKSCKIAAHWSWWWESCSSFVFSHNGVILDFKELSITVVISCVRVTIAWKQININCGHSLGGQWEIFSGFDSENC